MNTPSPTPSPITCTMQADGSAVMELFTEIGSWGYRLQDFTSALSSITASAVTLRINSPGGEVVEALAIHDLIKASDKSFTCEVYGLCASAATLIALACDSIKMAENATWMVHEPSFTIGGTLAECDNMRETMSALRDKVYSIYAAATGKDPEALASDHSADKYYSATEALAYGWVSEILNVEAPVEESETPAPDSPESPESANPPRATALSKLRAALGLASAKERLAAEASEWKRRALAAEAAARGAHSIAAIARAEAVAATENVEARIAAATASALAELAADPAKLPAPTEALPARPKTDLRAVASSAGPDAALSKLTALLD